MLTVSAVATILNFRWALNKHFVRPSNDYSCTVWVQSSLQFLRNFYILFSHRSYAKTLSCSGGNLEFLIDTKNIYLIDHTSKFAVR